MFLQNLDRKLNRIDTNSIWQPWSVAFILITKCNLEFLLYCKVEWHSWKDNRGSKIVTEWDRSMIISIMVIFFLTEWLTSSISIAQASGWTYLFLLLVLSSARLLREGVCRQRVHRVVPGLGQDRRRGLFSRLRHLPRPGRATGDCQPFQVDWWRLVLFVYYFVLRRIGFFEEVLKYGHEDETSSRLGINLGVNKSVLDPWALS